MPTNSTYIPRILTGPGLSITLNPGKHHEQGVRDNTETADN